MEQKVASASRLGMSVYDMNSVWVALKTSRLHEPHLDLKPHISLAHIRIMMAGNVRKTLMDIIVRSAVWHEQVVHMT